MEESFFDQPFPARGQAAPAGLSYAKKSFEVAGLTSFAGQFPGQFAEPFYGRQQVRLIGYPPKPSPAKWAQPNRPDRFQKNSCG
ncbi:MAG: hypothetical protein ACK53L_29645, partial [Pirellulaceae bacterium]